MAGFDFFGSPAVVVVDHATAGDVLGAFVDAHWLCDVARHGGAAGEGELTAKLRVRVLAVCLRATVAAAGASLDAAVHAYECLHALAGPEEPFGPKDG